MSPALEASAIVVGGGIWGCSIAYHLARAGLRDLVVLERRELASGNTPQAAGLVGQLRSSELMVRSIRHVVERLAHWTTEQGEESGFRQVGSLKLALTDGRVRELEEHVTNARKWGLEVELLTPQAATARVPVLDTAGVKAAAWIPGDGYVEPYTLAMAIARAARRLGVAFETDRPVTAIQLERGTVRGVDTPAGPVQHWTTAPMAEVPSNLPVVRVPDASVYIRPEVGGLMLGGFEARPKAFSMTELPLTFEIEHTEKDLGVLEELASGLTRAFPALDGAPVLKGCAGLPTFTPDGNYLIGAVPTVRGLWVAAGCNAIGIAGSLLIGEWLSELVLEGRTRVDTSSQALDRFGPRYAERRRLREACQSIYGNFYSLDKGAF